MGFNKFIPSIHKTTERIYTAFCCLKQTTVSVSYTHLQFLKDWQAMKELLDNGSQTQDNYEIWKTIRPSVTKVTHE